MTVATWALLVAIAALLVSAGSLYVAGTALARDRHEIRVWAVAYEEPLGKWSLSVTVANAGKRPISLEFLTIRTRGRPGQSRMFNPKGVRIEVGDAASTNVEPGDPLWQWSSLQQLHKCAIYVEDSLGDKYKAKFAGAPR